MVTEWLEGWGDTKKGALVFGFGGCQVGEVRACCVLPACIYVRKRTNDIVIAQACHGRILFVWSPSRRVKE